MYVKLYFVYKLTLWRRRGAAASRLTVHVTDVGSIPTSENELFSFPLFCTKQFGIEFHDLKT